MPVLGKHAKIIFTPEEEKFIRANYDKMTNREIASHFGIHLNVTRQLLYSMGLKRMELAYWTVEQVNFLKDNFQQIGDVELAEIFESKWPKNKKWTLKHIEKKRKYLKLKRSVNEIQLIFQRNLENGRFKDCPVKRWEAVGSNPIGTIVFWRQSKKYPDNKVPYIKTVIGYLPYYRWLWEQEFGVLSSNEYVVVKIGTEYKNLYLLQDLEIIDRLEHQRRNLERRMQYPDDIRKATRLINKIKKQIENGNKSEFTK
ncbi:hypothetical protein ACI6PS_02420 [Flavobacterium sp. PLA-1-15]|uniref:hypothetical protein n=1 Tax=Flavobacterium sp. PLA-1-15 TaxID=3380533 RepID=UPI003B78B339